MGFMSFLKEIGFDTFLDFLGFVTNIFYVLTPILFNMLVDQNSFEIESISIMSVFSMYVNAFIYFFLGLFGESNGNSFVLRDYCNLIGTFLGLVYLSIYFYERYKDEDIKKIILYYLLIVIISIIIIIFEYYFIIEKNSNVFNYLFKWIGVFPNVLEYFPIGFNIVYLFKNKKSKTFLIIGGTFGLINTIVWFIWAVYTTIKNKNDPQYHSIFANTLSISMNVLQYVIFFKYRRKDKVEYLTVIKNKYD